MTRTKARSCEGKVAYTERAAKAEQLRRKRMEASTLKAYHCDYGTHWHLGHRPKPRKVR